MRYEKAETVLRIASDMQGTAEGLSLEDIRNNYSDRPLSRRTAERLRDAIERVFPQMEQANPGQLPKRWRIRAGTLNGLVTFSAGEMAALQGALALLRRENMAVQAQEAASAISKLRAMMKPATLARIEPDLEALTEAEGLAMRPGPRPRIDGEIVGQLRAAILAPEKVRIHYRYRGSGKRGFETVRPYGFLYGDRNYLVAWSEGERARDFRSYALSNIERVEPLGKSFTRDRRFSLKAYAERSFGVFQEKPFNVAWKFSPQVAEDAKDFLFHPTQKLEPQKDGSLIVRFRAGGIQEMVWHLAMWGTDVTVLRPAKLRSDLATFQSGC